MADAAFTEQAIEESRRQLGLPADWVYCMCANGCGDITWVPPGALDVASAKVVCSADCATELLGRDGSGG